MAKIPAKQREEKLNAMNLAIRHTLEIEGWDAVTYKKLADTFDTRKSSIQKYFPSQQHFLLALDGISTRL